MFDRQSMVGSTRRRRQYGEAIGDAISIDKIEIVFEYTRITAAINRRADDYEVGLFCEGDQFCPALRELVT